MERAALPRNVGAIAVVYKIVSYGLMLNTLMHRKGLITSRYISRYCSVPLKASYPPSGSISFLIGLWHLYGSARLCLRSYPVLAGPRVSWQEFLCSTDTQPT